MSLLMGLGGYFTYCYSIEDYGIFADASDYCEELDDIVIKKEYKNDKKNRNNHCKGKKKCR